MGILSPSKLIKFPPFEIYVQEEPFTVSITEVAELQFSKEVCTCIYLFIDPKGCSKNF